MKLQRLFSISLLSSLAAAGQSPAAPGMQTVAGDDDSGIPRGSTADWCHTSTRWEPQPETLQQDPGGSSQMLGQCPFGNCAIQGACDQAATRNVHIPGSGAEGSELLAVQLQFHVFCANNGSACLVTQQQIDDQVARLNTDFAPVNIVFFAEMRFVNDSTYLTMDSFGAAPPAEEFTMKAAYNLNPSTSLNVYVTNLPNPVLGDAIFPWDSVALTGQSGIMIDFTAVTNQTSRVMTHEVGHALGLWHTHRGVSEVSCNTTHPCVPCDACYECVTAPDRNVLGDYCADTPATPENFTCGTPIGNDLCTGFHWGWEGIDPSNYMGSGPARNCINHFTPQQMGRARCWLSTELFTWLVNLNPIIYVPSEFPTLQEAVDESGIGTVIIVANGTYSGANNIAIDIDKSLTIRSENGPANCIIDCNSQSWGFRVFGADTQFVIEGMTIREGRGQFGGLNNNGGAIGIHTDASAIVRRCVIEDGFASNHGGGIAFDGGGSLLVDSCIIRNNDTAASGGLWVGGGLYVKADSGTSEVRIINSQITGNTARQLGGGLYFSNTNGTDELVFELRNCTIASNVTTNAGTGNFGGGLSIQGTAGQPTTNPWVIANCIFWGNDMLGLGSVGDQIDTATFGELVIRYCDVQGGLAGIWVSNEAPVWGPGNFNTDPQFQNAPTNYHLKKFSSCINAGDPAYVPFVGETDFDGAVRMLENRVEVGADERFFGAQQQQL